MCVSVPAATETHMAYAVAYVQLPVGSLSPAHAIYLRWAWWAVDARHPWAVKGSYAEPPTPLSRSGAYL